MKAKLILIILLICTVELDAQDRDSLSKGFEIKIESGYYGGLVINENFLVYNSGFGVLISPGFRVNKYFSVFGGIGLERLDDGVLIPFFVDFESYFSSKRKAFINAQFGYSAGFNNRSINIDYNYNGGFLFGIGVGRDLFQNEKVRLALKFGYNFRKAKFHYRPFPDTERITSTFEYNLFSGKLAFYIR